MFRLCAVSVCKFLYDPIEKCREYWVITHGVGQAGINKLVYSLTWTNFIQSFDFNVGSAILFYLEVRDLSFNYLHCSTNWYQYYWYIRAISSPYKHMSCSCMCNKPMSNDVKPFKIKLINQSLLLLKVPHVGKKMCREKNDNFQSLMTYINVFLCNKPV